MLSVPLPCRAMMAVQNATLTRGNTARNFQLGDLALACQGMAASVDVPQGLSLLVEKEKNIVRFPHLLLILMLTSQVIGGALQP